ncbi:MAG TPA: hypothetical protein VE912_13305 [Bacteroidales bacterium]|nr:hypothetical protein [Bacteroidales bacterium]
MPTYTLSNDGDRIEQYNLNRFLNSEFHAYEKFWQKHVIPLTNRPQNIHFKDTAQLKAIGKSGNDICIAQLHYSILRHLHRTYDIRQISTLNFQLFELTDGFVRLSGTLDIAFELLERYKNPKKYDPWVEAGTKSNLGGREARRNWQKNNQFPLQSIKNYRNHLIHGRMTPTVTGAQTYLPNIGKEKKYFDWRLITNPSKQTIRSIQNDYKPAKLILDEAWDKTIDYLQTQWMNELLP